MWILHYIHEQATVLLRQKGITVYSVMYCEDFHYWISAGLVPGRKIKSMKSAFAASCKCRLTSLHLPELALPSTFLARGLLFLGRGKISLWVLLVLILFGPINSALPLYLAQGEVVCYTLCLAFAPMPWVLSSALFRPWILLSHVLPSLLAHHFLLLLWLPSHGQI